MHPQAICKDGGTDALTTVVLCFWVPSLKHPDVFHCSPNPWYLPLSMEGIYGLFLEELCKGIFCAFLSAVI